jgi:hypothetical protein
LEDDNLGFTESEIAELSDDDEDYGHLKTEKRAATPSSKELLKRIVASPDYVYIPQTWRTDMMMKLLIVESVLFFGLGGVVVITNPSDAAISAVAGITVLTGLLWACVLCCYHLEMRIYRFMMSPEAVGLMDKYGNTAILWEHVEYVDIWKSGEKLDKIEFVGNRRRLMYERPWLHRELSEADLLKYLPDFDSWETMRKKSWRKGILRHVRP